MGALGKVYLVGAGPGAADLITVRGARLLAQADVVLYDALVTTEMLELCARAEKISVGKRSGQRSTAQTLINQQLVDCAKQYPLVVRLKGGDPMLFGRADEELRALEAEGIEVEVVPADLHLHAVRGHRGAVGGRVRLGVDAERVEVERDVVDLHRDGAVAGGVGEVDRHVL